MNEDMEYTNGFDPEQPACEPPAPKKKRGTAGLVAVALCCSLLGSAVGAGGVLAWDTLRQEEPDTTLILKGDREPSVIQIAQIDTNKVMTPAEVYAANVNSTVGITAAITTNFWGYTTTSPASGSGFIISDDGHILTNYHVIEDSSSISVSMYDGSSYDAVLVGFDESNDIAVLKIEAENLVPVVLGDSDNLNVGDSVVAIGNPLGELTFSLTAGTVSAKDREVTLSSNVTMDLIQTDCAINSGNSGGALFNLYGEVIGITNAKYSSGAGEASIDNIGFAIPVNDILPIVESIIEKGYVSKPYIGVSIYDVSAEAQGYGIPAGAAIQAVSENGPAQAAGLQAGDVITACNGTAVSGSAELKEQVSGCQVGDELTLTVYRQGQTMDLTLTVGEQISSARGEAEQQGSGLMPMIPGFGGRDN
ncbi:MAG: trypsin-like peptidase domain-containing protein [Oscillospiraceae bacterium]|nr:trypsin-like peptidase domain-containing protein [Oscillospiraceae bacterium]